MNPLNDEFIPRNEMGVVMIFSQMIQAAGWQVVSIQTAFPDVTIKNKDGLLVLAEIEYAASNFLLHGHDPELCDLIICWKNDIPDCPMPIWELSKPCDFLMPCVNRDKTLVWFFKREIYILKTKLNRFNGEDIDMSPRSVQDRISNGIIVAEAERVFYENLPLNAEKLFKGNYSIPEIASIIFGLDSPSNEQIRTIRDALLRCKGEGDLNPVEEKILSLSSAGVAKNEICFQIYGYKNGKVLSDINSVLDLNR